MSQVVRIFIDQNHYSVQTPISGEDLYDKAKVKEGLVLYKEVSGNREDTPIKIDAPEVHLKEDEHFHTGKAPENYFLIYVNTAPKVVHHEHLSFDQITKIAFPNPPNGTLPEFTVTFEHAESTPHQGSLQAGGKVTIKKHGTIFDVTHTNRS